MRKDIPVADQIVQVGHATMEAAREFPYQDNTHLVVLQVPDKKALYDAMERMEKRNIKYKAFFEPDDDMQETAICTESITGSIRHSFRKYQLWTE